MRDFNPLVSICIFTYNRANYIKETIESALAQTYKNFEIVVVNDGSTDDTEEVVLNIPSDKIRYFKKPHTNAPDTRNRALKEAKGDYILWLGDDDLLHEDILQIYINTLIEYPDVDILYCNLIAFNEHKGFIRQFVYKEWYNEEKELVPFLIIGQPIPDGSSLISKKVYDLIGEFNIDFNRAQDYEFYSRVVMAQKFKFKYVNEFLVKYRIHEKNITLNLGGKIDFQYEIKILHKLLDNYKLELFFPHLDWEGDFRGSFEEANYALGIKFFNYGAYPESIMHLSNSLLIKPDMVRLKKIIESFIEFGVVYELKILLFLVKYKFEGIEEIENIVKLIDNYENNKQDE